MRHGCGEGEDAYSDNSEEIKTWNERSPVVDKMWTDSQRGTCGCQLEVEEVCGVLEWDDDRVEDGTWVCTLLVQNLGAKTVSRVFLY